MPALSDHLVLSDQSLVRSQQDFFFPPGSLVQSKHSQVEEDRALGVLLDAADFSCGTPSIKSQSNRILQGLHDAGICLHSPDASPHTLHAAGSVSFIIFFCRPLISFLFLIFSLTAQLPRSRSELVSSSLKLFSAHLLRPAGCRHP